MNDQAKQFLDEYSGFVDSVTSDESKDFDKMIARLRDLHDSGINVPRLLTGTIGAASEGGEFAEIVKKMVFQGKPPTEENLFHLKREMGDEIWYWMQKCMALGLDPLDIIMENIKKLEARYPGGFDAWLSENRKSGDL